MVSFGTNITWACIILWPSLIFGTLSKLWCMNNYNDARDKKSMTYAYLPPEVMVNQSEGMPGKGVAVY